MNNTRITLNHCKMMSWIESANVWFTNQHLIQHCAVSAPVAARFTRHLVAIGVLEKKPIFPAPLFRLSQSLPAPAQEYLSELQGYQEAIAAYLNGAT